jgi:hypothetical protein
MAGARLITTLLNGLRSTAPDEPTDVELRYLQNYRWAR